MKKIITFLFSVSMMSSAFAQFGSKDQQYGSRDQQYGNKDQKDYAYGKKDVVFNDGKFKRNDDHFNDNYFFAMRERDMQLAQINREYDFKVQSLKFRLFMGREKKERLICMLEEQRKNEIQMVYAKFSDRGNRYDDHNQRRNW